MLDAFWLVTRFLLAVVRWNTSIHLTHSHLRQSCPSSDFFFSVAFVHIFLPSAEKKNVHYHHRKEFFWRICLASQKVSRPVVDTKPYKNQGKPYLPQKSLLCGPHCFRAKKSSSLEQVGVGVFFSPSSGCPSRAALRMCWRLPNGNPEKPCVRVTRVSHLQG